MNILEQLVNLHRVDSQLRGLRSRLEGAERHLIGQERLAAALERQKAEFEMQAKQLQAKVATLEMDAGAMDERVEKLRNELNAQQTHKAYTAFQNELSNLKADRANLDARTLAEMEQVEKIRQEAERAGEALADRIRIRDLAARELEERKTEVSDRVDQLARERETAAAAIPEETMDLFNRIARLYDGEALASVDEIDRRSREYACAACNVHLPFEAISKLRSPSGAVVQCQGCRRILFLQQDTRSAMAKK